MTGTPSLTIATFRGVPVRADLSLLILAVWAVSDAVRAVSNPLLGLVIGLATCALVVASVALHEFGHTAVALRYGCRVRDITLMLFGGRATLLDMPREPAREFWMAIAGPAVSAALWLLAGLLARLHGARMALVAATPLDRVALFLLGYLSWLNRTLLLFNLLPAFPMDGGRVLRSVLARRMGRLRATYVAMRVGKGMAILMGVYGIATRQWMLALIAYFVFTSAEAEYRSVQFEEGGWGGWWR